MMDVVDKMGEMDKPKLSGIIQLWVDTQEKFTKSVMDNELGIRDEQDKNTSWHCLERIVKQGKLVKSKGYYRVVDLEAPIQKWKVAKQNTALNIKFPFGIENYVKILPKSLIVVGGDSNAGKSAFAYNLISLNHKTHKMVLFNSESGDEELYERLSCFDGSFEWADDIVRFRSKNFADVIIPDAINIIDYIDPPDPLFLMAQILREIWEKLTTGVVFAMLQKPPGRDLPFGKDSTKWLARLLLSIDHGKLTIVKAKSWVDRNVNPNNKSWDFKLVGGYKFITQEELDF